MQARTIITAETEANVVGIMEGFGKAAYNLAVRANGTDQPDADMLEQAALVLANATLASDAGPLFATALAYTAGLTTGDVVVR